MDVGGGSGDRLWVWPGRGSGGGRLVRLGDQAEAAIVPWSPRTNHPLRGPLKVHRGKPRKRYDRRRYMRAAYRRLRKAVLIKDPWCKWPDCIEAALNADHIVPAAWGGPDTPDNLQGLCLLHHGWKTQLEMKAKTWPVLRRRLTEKGFDCDDLQRAEASLSN